MAETTKRERSTSPTQSETTADRPESKRPKEEAALAEEVPAVAEDEPSVALASAPEDASSSPQDETAADMTTEGDSTKPKEEQSPIEVDASAAANNGDDNAESKPSVSGEGGAEGATEGEGGDAEPQHISMRALIVTGDASIIIGKQGKHINEIRDKSGAKLTISESIPGNPERIMSVAGQLDAVSKAFGLIVRRINDEPFDQASLPGSRAVTIKFIVPNSRMGSVIGKGGVKIKEIQEASGARLNAGEQMLPGSTERVLSISGVADAVHIAVYYVGTILLEHPDRNVNNLSYRPTAGGSGAQVPSGAGSSYTGRGGGSGGHGGSPGAGYGSPTQSNAPAYGPGPPQLPPGSQTQQIFIPNDLVGCIIGKGGSKINEIRQMSASHIKIMEPGAGALAGGGANERLVTITGPPQNIQVAVQLLYQRLEQEKMRLANGGA